MALLSQKFSASQAEGREFESHRPLRESSRVALRFLPIAATIDAVTGRLTWRLRDLRDRAAVAAVVLAVTLSAADATTAGVTPVHPQIAVGGFPTGIALNATTDTIYVGNGTTGTLSLIDGRTCNALDASGCARKITAVTAGADPIGIAIAESTNTVYVVDYAGSVAVVDGRTCTARNTTGCRRAPATIRVGASPQFLAFDAATGSLYVGNVGSDTVSVIDTRTCNGAAKRGCGRVRATIPVGRGPFTLAVNDRTATIYVTNLGGTDIDVIDGRTCNAQIIRGCHRPVATVDVGQAPGGVAIDRVTDTVYVSGELTADVAVIDGSTCNGAVTRGCAATPVRVAAGPGARGIAVDEATHTVYVANTAANSVSVIDGAACNGRVHDGCDAVSPAAPVGLSPRRVAVDALTNTVYITNAGSDSVTMLNGRTCNARLHTGCGHVASTPSLVPATPGQAKAQAPYTATTRRERPVTSR